MQIDDTVKITGPDRLGNYNEHGTFKINMQWKDKVQNYYSDGDRPWFPESSLELVSKPKFQVGQKVRITGPSYDGREEEIGQCFNIESFTPQYEWYSALGMNFYRASSLELVEELAIGDEVEVVGPSRWKETHNIGAKFVIKEIWKPLNGFPVAFSAPNVFQVYPASSLRKISKPKLELIDEMKAKIGEAIWKKMNRDEDRLTSIEKQLADLDQANANINRRLDEQNEANSKLRKRIHVLEEHDMYQAGVNDDLRSRLASLEKSWMGHELERTSRLPKEFSPMRVDYEYTGDDWNHGHFNVVCPCGRKAVIALPESPVVGKILDEPEEIKAGDYAKVLKAGCKETRPFLGKIIHIKETTSYGIAYSDEGNGHDVAYLRKLSNAEISERLNEGQA